MVGVRVSVKQLSFGWQEEVAVRSPGKRNTVLNDYAMSAYYFWKRPKIRKWLLLSYKACVKHSTSESTEKEYWRKEYENKQPIEVVLNQA